jgi:DNA gyrase subunit A
MSNKEDYSFPGQKIKQVDMAGEVRQSFLAYSMSVITARALPDVRDGLKPGQRRILWAMWEDNLTADKPFRKSATTVGNVLGRYHPHGDTAVYLTMARMAQPFSLRYPLVEGHGNYGNVDGDGPAAYRYTEARLARLADEMLRDIDKNAVRMDRNFDNTREEPAVLPSRFPNILVNGSVGIAVGMATNIPPHNLGEVIDGTILLMENPDATVYDLMRCIKGPDFPTAAIAYGAGGILEAYATGRGRVAVRSRATVEEEHHRIIITEIPYMLNKSALVKEMADLVREKRIEGVTDIRDESGRDGMRIVVEYRRDANGQVILNQFYKNCSLQSTCAINMLALVNGEPKTLPLKDLLNHYIAHQRDVVARRVRYDLAKAEAEAHIYEGYKIAIDNIDEVVSIIRASASQPDAKERLSERFSLSEAQSQAIVDMTLGRLTGLERQKVEDRLAKLYAAIAEFKSILGDPRKIDEIIKTDMLEIKRRFGDSRRTEIVETGEEIIIEDLIDRHQCVVTMTRDGYIKRMPADAYGAQHRGGRGVVGMGTKEEDEVVTIAVVHSHSTLLMFTNRGRVYRKRAFELPESSRTSKGANLVNLLQLGDGERVTAMLSISSFSDNEGASLVMCTRYGMIKRTPLAEFDSRMKGGKIAIGLRPGDELSFVCLTDGDSTIFVAKRSGLAARFDESAIRETGRTSRGVFAIKLGDRWSIENSAGVLEGEDEDETDAADENETGGAADFTNLDEVIGMFAIKPSDSEKYIMTLTENGFGKLTAPADFPVKGRNIKGVICHVLNEKTGALTAAALVELTDDLFVMTDDGTVIRFAASDVRICGRSAAGVRVMRPADGAVTIGLASLPCVEGEDEHGESGGDDSRGSAADGSYNSSERPGDDIELADVKDEDGEI